MIKNSGFLNQEAIHLIQDGNFTRLPMLTTADIKRAYDFFGEPEGSVRGKMTKRKVCRAMYDNDLIMDVTMI